MAILQFPPSLIKTQRISQANEMFSLVDSQWNSKQAENSKEQPIVFLEKNG
jgi:hypothetical protein